MDKKRLEYYKKKLVTRREELARGILRTEQEAPGSGAVDALLHHLPGKERTGAAVSPCSFSYLRKHPASDQNLKTSRNAPAGAQFLYAGYILVI